MADGRNASEAYRRTYRLRWGGDGAIFGLSISSNSEVTVFARIAGGQSMPGVERQSVIGAAKAVPGGSAEPLELRPPGATPPRLDQSSVRGLRSVRGRLAP